MWTVEILDKDGKVVDTAYAVTREDARAWGRRFAGTAELVKVFQFATLPAESVMNPTYTPLRSSVTHGHPSCGGVW